ncbi:MAG: PQQ-binding-like beta-propeller repeat protein [Candidatus Berkelbacteria bacterium]|nr:PQQ-binding-like beta-propeller repeat protein [Candidatus Berkelbacteria bacterium]
MNEINQRPGKGLAIVIVLAVLVVAGLAVGSYYLFGFKKNNASNNTSTSTTLWPKSNNPWSMFHGNYNHTGYADVSGPATNQLKWKYLVGGKVGIGANSVVVSKEGTVFVAGNNKIIALNADGSLKWAKDYISTQGPSLSEDGTTLYFDSDTSLIAASSLDGSKKWEFKTGNNVVFGPTIGPDGTIYQGSWDKYFYAINPDGTLKWKYLTKGTISYPASIDKNGNIYLGGGDAHFGPDGNIYAFDKDGKSLWTYDTKMLRVGSPAIGYDDLLYFPASPVLFVLNTEGKLVWKKGPDVTAIPGGAPNGAAPVAPCDPPPAPCSSATNAPDNNSATGREDIAGIITPAITPDGIIYIGTSQGKIFAIDSKTQETKWTYQTGKNPEQKGVDYGLPSFVMADKDGTSYFGSVDYKFYAMTKDGKVKWTYETGGKIMEAAPAIGADGTIYFTSEDGYLYAIGS